MTLIGFLYKIKSVYVMEKVDLRTNLTKLIFSIVKQVKRFISSGDFLIIIMIT